VIRERPAEGPIVEPIGDGDLDAIVEIERVSFKTPWGKAVFQEEAGREWAHIWVVRTEPEAPALGFINFWLVRDEIHILNVAVLPAERRKGYAAEMIQRTLTFAWKHHVRYLTLEVRRSNQGAIKLYKSFDFKPIGIRPNYYSDDREDAIVMMLTLGPASTG
jgi:[ribosomal protein S18]-alanine N-acetyltransferase